MFRKYTHAPKMKKMKFVVF